MSEHSGSAKILLIDNVEERRAQRIKRMQRFGHTITEAFNLADICKMIAEDHFDFVIFDPSGFGNQGLHIKNKLAGSSVGTEMIDLSKVDC